MTDDRKKQVSEFFWAELLKRLFGYGMLGAVGILMYLFTPLWSRVVAIWDSPKALHAIQESQRTIDVKIDLIQHELSELKVPTKIFEVSIINSGPVEGFCIELEPCNIRLKIRRTIEAETCRLVQNSTRWFFVNPRTDNVSVARRIDVPQNRNVGRAWETIDVEISTPSGLAPDSDFYFQSSYRGCPNQRDEANPIVDASEPIPIQIQTRQ